VEVVGTYNPRTNPATFDLKTGAHEHWVSKGAQLSDPGQENCWLSPRRLRAASVA